MKIYIKATSGLDNYTLSEKDIMLGDTPARQFIWSDKDKQVAKLNVFDWWDGLNIEDLEINPDYRGKGLSYKLLDFATKKLGAKNLAVAKDNTIAKHVYDKYGFEVTDEDNDYYYMSIS